MAATSFSDISEYFNRIFQKIVDVVTCKSDFARLIEFSPSISIAASISGVSQCRVRLAARPVRMSKKARRDSIVPVAPDKLARVPFRSFLLVSDLILLLGYSF